MKSPVRRTVVAVALLASSALASPAAGYAAPRQDDGMILSFDRPCYRSYTLWEFRRAARIAYRHQRVAEGSSKALRRFERCQRPPSTPRAAGRLWRSLRAAWEARYAPRLPFGRWAIPAAIVMCESRGENLPPNSAGASGFYQVIPSTWTAYGGAAYASQAYLAAKSDQDRIAGRIWDGGAGASQWVCTGIVG